MLLQTTKKPPSVLNAGPLKHCVTEVNGGPEWTA